MHAGNFVLALHTHLPYVLHHGDWPHGTDWLCEAVAECYIPLMNVFNELLAEGIAPKVTLDISPVLCDQMAHKDFPALFERYCDTKIDLATKDADFFSRKPEEAHFTPLAKFWAWWYADKKKDFIEKYKGSIIGGLKELQDKGAIEIITCGATHGYYPLLGEDKSIRLQMRASVAKYEKHFGRKPNGTWLPECAYRPAYPWRTFLLTDDYQTPQMRMGVEQLLAENGLKFFFADQHAGERANALGVFTGNPEKPFVPVYSPLYRSTPWNFDKTPLNIFHVASNTHIENGTSIVFLRHQKVAMQVWSGESGYPGDPDYLEFHKKHYRSGIRYWRITDNKADMQYKQPYVPEWAYGKTEIQAHHFIKRIEATLIDYARRSGKFGTLCVPFDTELFGHWWFEGPYFIKALLRGLHHSPYVNTATASEQVNIVQPREVMSIPEVSWGEGGHHKVWMNDNTQWTWYLIYNAERRFDELLTKFPASEMNPTMRRIATQAMRELMLLQSSDWQFLIHTFSAKDYAEKRFFYHNNDFNTLCHIAEKYAETNELTAEQEKYLADTEFRNTPFPELQIEWWSNKSVAHIPPVDFSATIPESTEPATAEEKSPIAEAPQKARKSSAPKKASRKKAK